MGFLKKKSSSKLVSSSGGDFSPVVSSNKSISSVSRASFPVIAMPDCRDDTSVAIASIAPSQTTARSPSSRVRSPDSESIIINSNLILDSGSIKSPTAARSGGYPRREESISISSHATKQISNHGQAKLQVKSPISRRPFKGTKEVKQQQKSPSAKAQTAGAAKGKSYYESSPRSANRKPAMTKSKTMIHPKRKPRRRESVSSDDSSDDSDDDDDETNGSYTDDGLDTDGGEDTTMYTRDSAVSFGGSSTFEEDESVFGIMGKFGWNAKKGELTDDEDGTMNRDTLLSNTSDECDTIRQKESEHSGFMRKMDEFMASNQDHQLIVQVSEHGNIEKLSLQVSLLHVYLILYLIK